MRWLAAVVCATAALTGAAPAAAAREARSSQAAIAAAVRDRVGEAFAVDVELLDTDVEPAPALTAIPDPGARTDQVSRFVLATGRTRIGIVRAIVRITGRHVRAAKAIARGETIDAASLIEVDDVVPDATLHRLPSLDEAAGLIARRAVAAGEVVSDAIVTVPPTVRAGAPVSLTVVLGAVRATGVGVAASSGHEGDLISIMPTPTRRTLRARITGPGAAEVIQ
ncbi:MAG: flagellar basal body P-ring formation chaperone FlgA [Vicinamibacterales bacterium]